MPCGEKGCGSYAVSHDDYGLIVNLLARLKLAPQACGYLGVNYLQSPNPAFDLIVFDLVLSHATSVVS